MELIIETYRFNSSPALMVYECEVPQIRVIPQKINFVNSF